jgi:hypothetical protein
MADHGYDNHDQANTFNALDKNSVCIMLEQCNARAFHPQVEGREKEAF